MRYERRHGHVNDEQVLLLSLVREKTGRSADTLGVVVPLRSSRPRGSVFTKICVIPPPGIACACTSFLDVVIGEAVRARSIRPVGGLYEHISTMS